MTRDVGVVLLGCSVLGLWVLALTVAVAQMRRQHDRLAACVTEMERDLTAAEATIKKLKVTDDQHRRLLADLQRRRQVAPPVRPPVPPTNPIPNARGRHARRDG